MKLTEDRPYAKPEAAARLLLDIVRASIVASDLTLCLHGSDQLNVIRVPEVSIFS